VRVEKELQEVLRDVEARIDRVAGFLSFPLFMDLLPILRNARCVYSLKIRLLEYSIATESGNLRRFSSPRDAESTVKRYGQNNLVPDNGLQEHRYIAAGHSRRAVGPYPDLRSIHTAGRVSALGFCNSYEPAAFSLEAEGILS
jgi:hypothetical protein